MGIINSEKPKLMDIPEELAICTLEECPAWGQYSFENRLRNQELLGKQLNGLEKIEVLILGESPPSDGGYIYAKTRKSSFGLYSSLERMGKNPPFGLEKHEFEMEFNSKWIVIDCALCPVSRMGMKNKKECLKSCFKGKIHTLLDNLDLENLKRIIIAFPGLGHLHSVDETDAEVGWILRELKDLMLPENTEILAGSPWDY